jgi:hypothetical protein
VVLVHWQRKGSAENFKVSCTMHSTNMICQHLTHIHILLSLFSAQETNLHQNTDSMYCIVWGSKDHIPNHTHTHTARQNRKTFYFIYYVINAILYMCEARKIELCKVFHCSPRTDSSSSYLSPPPNASVCNMRVYPRTSDSMRCSIESCKVTAAAP